MYALPAVTIAQVAPEDHMAYYNLSQQLVLELAQHPEKMDSIMAEIDTLDTLLRDKKKTDEKKSDDEITGIFLQYRSDMCEGYCITDIKVYPLVKTVVRYPGTVDGRPSDWSIKKEVIELVPEDWQQVLASFTLKKIKELPQTNGCPGCDDGSIGSLSVFTETDRYDVKFEAPKPPEAIQGLTRLITADVFKE